MISGTTRIIAHLGVPTASFRAPLIYNPYFEAEAIDCAVVPMGCEAADLPVLLPALFRLRNIAGALITMPHKVAVTALLDHASVAVRACGACNAVRREADGSLSGDMFDGAGFVRGAERHGQRLAGAAALVVGAGGVGAAIAVALAGAGVARIGLSDLDQGAARRLAERLRAGFPGLDVTTGAADPTGRDIVVNATPLGMRPDDPLPVDPDRLAPGCLVGDVVLSEEVTPFLAAARARGCRTQVGLDMLFEQIPAYLEFFGLPVTSADRLRHLARLPRG